MIYRNATAEPRDELTDFVMESVTNNGMFIGAEVLPFVPLSLPTGHYPKITVAMGDLMRAATANRAPGAGFARWQAAVDDGTLTLLQYAEELQVPDEQQMVYDDYFDLEQVFSLEAKNRVQRLHEILVAAQLQSATTFTATAAGVNYTAANVATISFVNDTLAAIRRVKATGEVPNCIIMSGTLYDRIRVGTLVQNFVAGANQPGAVVNPNTIQRAFEEHGIKKVYVADSYVNQSSPGLATAAAITPIWNSTYYFVGNVQSGALRGGGVGRSFFWEKEGQPFNIATYRDETKKSNIVRAMTTVQCAITNSRAGQLVTSGYA
jgi:hypothetical protein